MKTRTKSTKQNLSIIETFKPRKKSQSKNQINKQKQSGSTNIQQASVNKLLAKSAKQTQEARKYLQKTLNILSHRFNLGSTTNLKNNQSSSVLNLSTSVYKIVKENVSIMKRQNLYKQNISPNLVNVKSKQSKIRDQILKDHDFEQSTKNSDSRRVILSEKQHQQKPRSSSAMAQSSILQVSSICHNQSSINCQIVPSNQNSIFVKRRSNSTLDSYFREKFGTNAQDQEAVQKKLRVIKALKKSQQIVNKSNRSQIQSSMILNNCDVNQKSIVMQKLRGRNQTDKLR